MLDPKEEREIGECCNVVDGGDLEIIAMVQSKVGLARGDIEDIEEIDSDSDDDNPEVVPPSLKEMIEACQMLEENCLLFGTDSLDLVECKIPTPHSGKWEVWPTNRKVRSPEILGT